jgi:hypothetical protein
MSDLERQRAQHEAAGAAATTPSSADRARLWAGMNRYPGTEAEHEDPRGGDGEQGVRPPGDASG